MMDPHLRGLLVGLFLGVGVGMAMVLQPSYGWPSTLGTLGGIAILAWAENVYFHRKPEAAQ
jgi:hypothetical protein